MCRRIDANVWHKTLKDQLSLVLHGNIARHEENIYNQHQALSVSHVHWRPWKISWENM